MEKGNFVIYHRGYGFLNNQDHQKFWNHMPFDADRFHSVEAAAAVLAPLSPLISDSAEIITYEAAVNIGKEKLKREGIDLDADEKKRKKLVYEIRFQRERIRKIERFKRKLAESDAAKAAAIKAETVAHGRRCYARRLKEDGLTLAEIGQVLDISLHSVARMLGKLDRTCRGPRLYLKRTRLEKGRDVYQEYLAELKSAELL